MPRRRVYSSQSALLDPPAAEDARAVVEHHRLPRRDRRLRLGRSAPRRRRPPSRVTVAGHPGVAVADLRRARERLARRVDSQFTRDATSPSASRSSGSPTTTVFVSGTISSTNRFRPAATPSPFRWPTVNRSMPSCSPRTVPSFSTIAPARRRPPGRRGGRRRRGRRSARSRSRRCPACPRRPAARPRGPVSRISAFASRRPGTAGAAAPRAGCRTGRTTGPCPGRRPVQLRTVRPRQNAGVVAGGDEVGAELLAERPQLAELQPGVAHDARVRRAAAGVLVGEVVDDRSNSRSKSRA